MLERRVLVARNIFAALRLRYRRLLWKFEGCQSNYEMLTSYCHHGINWRNDSCLFCWKAVTIVAGCRMFPKLLNTKCLHCVCTGLRRRIGVSHPNLFSFLKQLQNVITDNMADLARIRNGMGIRRPKKKRNMQNDARIKWIFEVKVIIIQFFLNSNGLYIV